METIKDTVAEAAPAIASAEVNAAPARRAQSEAFRQASVLADGAMRKLRVRHDEFARALSARLSLYFRMDFGVEVTKVQTMNFQKFVERLVTPTHLTLFKLEPLRGTGLFEVPPQFALSVVERMLGGVGAPTKTDRDLTEIEAALLDQITEMLLTEWCGQWRDLQDLKFALLGHEIEGRFLNTARETLMLEISLTVTMGESTGQCRIGFPYRSLEPMFQRLDGDVKQETTEPAKPATPALQWSRQFDDVPVDLTAICDGLRLTARELGNLKVGDTLPVGPQQFNQIEICFGKTAKFVGTLGTGDGVWAVQLTKKLEAQNR